MEKAAAEKAAAEKAEKEAAEKAAAEVPTQQFRGRIGPTYRRKFRSQTSDLWTDDRCSNSGEKSQRRERVRRERVREEERQMRERQRRRRRRNQRRERGRRKKFKVREKVEKSRDGRKVGSL